MPEGGIADGELLKRRRATNKEAFAAAVAKELAAGRRETGKRRGEGW